MTAEQGPRQPQERVEGVGESAEERSIIEVPPAVDPGLVDRAHRRQEEIAEDERTLDEPQV
jgi:hypothetical protein